MQLDSGYPYVILCERCTNWKMCGPSSLKIKIQSEGTLSRLYVMKRLSVRKIENTVSEFRIMTSYSEPSSYLWLGSEIHFTFNLHILCEKTIQESTGEFQSSKFPVYSVPCPRKNNLDYCIFSRLKPKITLRWGALSVELWS